MEEKKKSNAGLVIIIILLLVACAGMGSFIFTNRDKLVTVSKNDNHEVKAGNETTSTAKDSEKECTSTEFAFPANTDWQDDKNEWHIVAGDPTGTGVTFMADFNNQHVVNVTANWDAIEGIYNTPNDWSNRHGKDTLTITFDQDVVDIQASSNGQAAPTYTAFFVLRDGSVYKASVPCGLKGKDFQTVLKKIDTVGKIVKLYRVEVANKDPNLSLTSYRMVGMTVDGKLQAFNFEDSKC